MELEDVTPEALATAIKRSVSTGVATSQCVTSGRSASFTMRLPNGQEYRVMVEEL